jgi:hypothetical protein
MWFSEDEPTTRQIEVSSDSLGRITYIHVYYILGIVFDEVQALILLSHRELIVSKNIKYKIVISCFSCCKDL